MIYEWWFGKEMEGNDRDMFEATALPALAQKEAPARIAGVRAGTGNWGLGNSKQECYHSNAKFHGSYWVGAFLSARSIPFNPPFAVTLPDTSAWRWRCRLVIERCSIRNSAGTSACDHEVSWLSSALFPRSGRNWFLSYPFQLIIYPSSCHSAL
jgi:hypothetical protein